MMKPIDNHEQHRGDSSFDYELERFFESRPVAAGNEYAANVCSRVKAESLRTDRAFRATVYGIAASVILSVILWFGVFSADGENVFAVEETINGNIYTEVHVLEDMLFGAEALGDEDALDTLALLLGN